MLRDHEQGAAKAAWKLKEAVKEAGFGHDIPILVRVYANIDDLAKSLRMSGVIEFEDHLRKFAEQFTNTYADCDFINVGKGKENADSKIRSEFLRRYEYEKETLRTDAYTQGCLTIITKMLNVR